MKTKAKFPWVRCRIVDCCALIGVPKGWTLDWRSAEDKPQSEPVRFVDGQTATIPVGLGDIRLMPGVRKGAVNYWERWFKAEMKVDSLSD